MQKLIDWCKAAPLAVLPHHAVSRLVYWLTRREGALVTPIVKRFIAMFNVDMHDAVEPDPSTYPTFNQFFTRALKSDARPIANGEDEIACPADGRISAIGAVENTRLFQAKGKDYSLAALLADENLANEFSNGSFITVYLSPRDYHRLHMPLSGELVSQSHVPGRLYSVAPHTVRTIDGIFARNERVVAVFNTPHGKMVLVLVGAINVAAIETVWHGLVTPSAGKAVKSWKYAGTESRVDNTANLDKASVNPNSESDQTDQLTRMDQINSANEALHEDDAVPVHQSNQLNTDSTISLQKGEEMGRFNMGSTIIAVFEKPVRWRVDMAPGDAVRMGQFIGHETH